MTESLRLAWTMRSLREQRLLLVMFALVAIVLVWLVVIRPLDDALSASRARLDEAGAESGVIAARVEDLRAARRLSAAALDTSLVATVGAIASEAGFEPSRLDVQGEDRAVVSIASARAPALFDWLARLQARGIFVERIALRPNSDSTISVDATLRARRP